MTFNLLAAVNILNIGLYKASRYKATAKLSALTLLDGWEEGHLTHRKTRFNTPYYQGGNS